jgi:hypothetical protein
MVRLHLKLAALTLIASVLAGCVGLQQHHAPELPPLPSKKQMRVGPRYLFVSDVDIKPDHPLLKDLEGLQEQVCRELHLPLNSTMVFVYLFADRSTYDKYIRSHFKNLPPRRAFFMARTDERRGDELMVYTFWGDRIQEDLRHELTHAELHSVCKHVPMWLDEGLAEYFEVPPSHGGMNHRHLSTLRSQPGIPWSPNLGRLERLTLVKDMNHADYREAWAWVHFMLRGNPQAKNVLLSYLQQLRSGKEVASLEAQLAAVVADPVQALRDHIAGLEAATRSLDGLTNPGFTPSEK